MSQFATCDLLDNNEALIDAGQVSVLHPRFNLHLGQKKVFSGQAVTLKIFEDNTLVRTTLEAEGKGCVLVIDGGASMRCALVGGNLGVLAQKNNWAGIVVNGCVRDSKELNDCHIGIRALGLHPQKTKKLNTGQLNVVVDMGGVRVTPNDWVYCDEDGVIISKTQLK